MTDKSAKNKRPLILIAGPTGVGKSGVAVELAKSLDGEIISADSVAVYKYLDIGSAKPTVEEQGGIRHHLIDVLDPNEYFGVDRFVSLAGAAYDDIVSRGKIPIMVGGTAFYIQAFLYGVDFESEGEHDDSFRVKAMEEAETDEGKNTLFNRLKSVDPEYAETVHPNNVKRVIRALEYNHYTGRKFSEYNKEQSERNSLYDFAYYAINMDRDALYERIDKRVDMMIDSGLEEEVRGILKMGYDRSLNPLMSIGYKEMCSYIYGECNLTEAVNAIKQNSRHFAKRQITWLKREKDVRFINREDHNNLQVAEEIINDIDIL